MISFCISSMSDQYINEIIDSIKVLNIDRSQIILNKQHGVTLTKKKNDMVKAAANDIVVILHDYIKFYKDWFVGFEKFGYDWDVCMNQILNTDGSRFRDWCYWKSKEPDGKHPTEVKLANYNAKDTENMYISGAYWVAKKKYMLEHPLDEKLDWGQGEDVVWCCQNRKAWNYKMNIHSKVSLLKYKDVIIGKE